MSQYFITSSGTEIGKTFVTALLCYQARRHYKNIMAVKPVISGMEDGIEGSDTAIIAKALGRAPSLQTIETLSPFRYQAPLSPAMAAKLEGKELSYSALIESCKHTLAQFDTCLIEGVGGSFVPLTDKMLVADWIKDLGLSSLLVVGNYLGAQSHTLATVEAMQARNLPIKAIIVSESAGDNPDLQETVDTIKRFTQIDTYALPRLQSIDHWQQAPDLAPYFF